MFLFCCSFPLLLMTFTKESKLLGWSGSKGKGMKTRLMECTRGLGYTWAQVPLLLRAHGFSPAPLSPPAMVMAEAEENAQPSSHRKGKLIMGFSEKVPPYARTLSLPCARISHQQDKKKCKILEWACIITLILLRVSASQAEVIHSLFWSCSSPL